jgi:YggT family protein
MITQVLNYFFQILFYVILARVILSWVPHNPNNSIIRYLYSVTDPLLKPFKFARVGMIDLSPLLLMVTISIVRWLVLPLLGGI